jgi:hypothetical protein
MSRGDGSPGLPWDYEEVDLDPDEQPVADAVQASMSIPFFYEPIPMKTTDEHGREIKDVDGRWGHAVELSRSASSTAPTGILREGRRSGSSCRPGRRPP